MRAPGYWRAAPLSAIGGQRTVELVRADPRQPGDGGGRRARLGARPDQLTKRGEGVLPGGRPRGGRCADEHYLPPGRVLAIVLGQLGCAPAANLLVQLRELAADRHPAVGIALGEQLERTGEPSGRLVGDE